MTAESARASDFPAIVRLLTDAALPHDDLTPEHLRHFLVLRDGDGIAGVVGMEVADDAGLLRSLAVSEGRRGGGLAARLVDALEARAASAGIRTLYLLTTTAEDFFARRGYARADRAAVPDAIAATPEFRGICPASAACMSKALVPAAV
ncbi:MAG TPA: arsenic resistance N-acetyltransferase ArsN2 [Longimicrobium sp.]|jgi:amino-acid N-acetyltransferase|uniref:arsenic resistance N-acetyltransferase ArsN2 n=1 Tax=Longimicrobium sp. TaxID=2029185 RepID=UPI002EDA54E4